ncbi:hypothetical protein niasHS_016167 [Heterodera schachtii]|uniref:EGF-like domain-containing protein n=1 Tax=Heterodera schachtii TaxID=97005 RepID=A0ABD2HXZ7_HETSC
MNSFSLLIVFLYLIINCSSPPIRPLSSEVGIWKRCNGKNGIILVENGCTNSEELIGCYKSSKKWPGNSPIAEMCQKHLEGISGGADANANVAGFIVKICAHRNENDLVIESIFNISFSNKTCKRTRAFPISLEKITDIKHWMPTFLIEFGTDQRKSAIREKGDEKSICEGLKTSDGIGTILNDIEPQMVDGTLAKMIHFVPPSNDVKMLPFFQIERPKFSKLITIRTKLLPYQNNPNKFNSLDPCDKYGADCVPIRNLLLKIEELENCGKNESENNAAFKKPDWAPLPPAMPWKKPSETLICDGDLFCDKRRLHEQYNRLREICGLKPGEVESQRKKRQYNAQQKWTESPIKITFDEFALPKDGYQKWKDAIKIGAALIMEVTCVRFEFVDDFVDGENGIAIADDTAGGVCGRTSLGRQGGWQSINLALTLCGDFVNMSVVAGHELMHALGFEHEQSRSLYDRITLPRFYQQTIGQRERISFKDAAIINRIYCEDSCKGHEDKCQNGGYLNPNDCTKCHCPDGYGGEYCKELEESAKLCCPRALTDLNANEYKNWIEAETPDMDIVISARLSPKWTVPSTVFELTYESGNVKLINSNKCVNTDNLFAEKRNPGTIGFKCYEGVKHQFYECSCHGDKKCLAEEKWAVDAFLCPIIKLNGIQIQGSRQRVFTDPKDFRFNWTRIEVHCYKAEAGTVSFWGYSKPETNEIIRVDEVHCLSYKAAGVPERFKSLQVVEQPPVKKLSPSPLLANASSLIHVFVPFVGHP